MNGKMGTRVIREGLECFVSLFFLLGETLGFSCNVAVGEVDTISLSDVEEAWAWKVGDIAHFSCHVFWDVADMVAVMGEYLNGVWIVGVCWFCFQNSNRFTKIFINVVTILNACYIKSYHIKMAVVFWPYAHMVAFVFDAEVLKFTDGRILFTVRVNGYSDVRNGRFYTLIATRVLLWLWMILLICMTIDYATHNEYN